MKNDLTCAVVRDLLPANVEGLTSPETNSAVERHLADCQDCARLRADLAGEAAQPPEEAKEVDYLRAVKRRGRRRVAAAVAVTVLVLALGIAVKLFVIGEAASRESLSWITNTTVPGQLDIRFYSDRSAAAFSHWNVTNENGIVRINAKKVLPSFLYNTADHWEHISLDGVREVWVANQLVWQGGVEISPQIDRVYQAKTPYVGDAPAVGRVVQALRFDVLGGHTMELQTSVQPYRLTLNFSTSQSPDELGDSKGGLYQDMAAALALIGNLDEVECAFQDEDGQPWSYVLTAEQLNRDLPQIVADHNERFSNSKSCPLYDSVKDYAASCADLQQLYDAMWWAVEGGIYAGV